MTVSLFIWASKRLSIQLDLGISTMLGNTCLLYTSSRFGNARATAGTIPISPTSHASFRIWMSPCSKTARFGNSRATSAKWVSYPPSPDVYKRQGFSYLLNPKAVEEGCLAIVLPNMVDIPKSNCMLNLFEAHIKSDTRCV